MKKHSILLSVLGLVALAASCLPETSATLEVSPSEINLPAAGGEATITVSSNGVWKASSSDAWISVSPAEGDGDGEIKITVQPNANATGDAESRMGTVVIAGAETKKVIVLQDAQDYVPEDLLAPGSYSVAQAKKVSFAKGNLKADGSFAEKQSEFGDLFKADMVPSVANFFLLSPAEWDYLLNQRPGAAQKCAFKEVDGVFGLVIMPDSESAIDAAKGLFLPAAGYCYNEDAAGQGEGGSYWAKGELASVDFDATAVYANGTSLAVIGQSVRLACVSEE